MKKFIYISSLLFITILINSCSDSRIYDVPKLETPKYTTSSNIITIAELKTRSASFPLPNLAAGYTNSAGNFEVRTIDNTNLAIKGIVSANDESGNIYKQFYIQDESGAIVIGTNSTGLFPLFSVGQEVIIELDGLCIGKYGGSYQIGSRTPYLSYNTNGSVKNASIGRMTPTEFGTHVFRNGIPDPTKITIPTLTSVPEITESNRSTLVKFENVNFPSGGTSIFAPKGSSYGSVNLSVDGSLLLVRTSEYANFAADTVPTGTGSVICVLGKYLSTVQLTIRSRADLFY